MSKVTRLMSFVLALALFLSVGVSAWAETTGTALEDLDMETWTQWAAREAVRYGSADNIGKTVQTTEDNVWIYKEAKTSQNSTDENVLEVLDTAGAKMLVIGYVDGELYSEFYQVQYGDVTGYIECRQVKVYEAPIVDMETDPVTVGDVTITVEGSLPEGTKMKASTISDDLASAVGDVFSLNDEFESYQIFGYDMCLDLNGEKIQPGEEGVIVTLDGITVGEDDVVYVYHLMDDVDAINAAIEKGTAVEISDANFAAQFPAEAAAAAEATGKDDTIYFETYSSESVTVMIGEANIAFSATSFSRYVIASGNTSVSEAESDDKRAISQDSTYWVMPDTTLVLYSHNKTDNVSWIVDSPNEIGLESNNSASKYEIIIPNDNSYIGKTTKIKVQDAYNVEIIVKSKADIVNETLGKYSDKEWEFAAYPMVLMDSSTQGVPGEPNVNEYDFKRISQYRSYRPASNVIDSKIVDVLTTSEDGTCTLGLVDYDGNITKNYIKIQNITIDGNGKKANSWDDLLISAVKNGFESNDGKTDIYASDGVKLNDLSDEDLLKTYELIPYVIKMQTNRGYTWNIDCYIAPKSERIRLSYDLNPPSGYTTVNLTTPNSKIGTRSVTDTITTTPNDMDGRCWYQLNDINGSYWHFFEGWSTSKNGNVQYKAGQTITVTENTTLYGQWSPIYHYTLNFDPNGGTGAPEKKTSEGKRGNLSGWTTESSYTFNWTEVPTRAGYIFTGWSSNANDNSPEYEPTAKSYTMTGNYGSTKVETLYACWQPVHTLTVEKKVPDAASGQISGGEEFSFDVNFSGQHIDVSTITGSKNGSAVAVTKNGTTATASVGLKAGETVVFSGVPKGTTYTVTETANANYNTPDAQTGTISANTTATITNTLKTGKLTLKKNVKDSEFDSGSREFEFTVQANDFTANQLAYMATWAAAKGYTWNATDKTLKVKVTVNGASDPVEHSGSVTLEGIPLGSYTVTESEAEGYVTKYTVGNNITDTPQAVTVNGDDSSITITNTANAAQTIIVEKTWVDLDDAGKKRPGDLTVKLYAGGNESELASAEWTKKNNVWEKKWENVPVYDENGQKYDYTVSETVPDSYKLDETKSDLEGVYDEETKTLAFSLTNEILLGTLTIHKTGMESTESAVFKVNGPGYEGTVIVRNGQPETLYVTCGDYTVTEVDSWTWRYAQQKAQTADVDVDGASVTFANQKSKNHWLSGDNHAKNVFGK